MSDKPNNPFQFWQELKRRKVIRVIPVYAAASFVLLELVDIITEPFGLPDSTLKFVFVLLCVGFIISIILSWVYDVTPEGVKKTKPVKEVQQQEPVKPTGSTAWKIATYISVVIIAALVVFQIVSSKKQVEDLTELEKSIAVLPFTSLSDDPDKQYLADGVMDEILLHLSKIADLRVLSRTSVVQYRETDKTATEICQELDVAYVLEGSFQKYGDEARLIVQLIKSGKEAHEWSDKYDRNWNDIFSVQSEVAQTIARELHAVITPEEKQLIERIPTANLKAYDYYLLGRHFRNQRSPEELIKAIEFFEKAIEADPEFVKAYTGLAHCNMNLAYHGIQRPKDTYPPAMNLALRALELDSLHATAYNVIAAVNTFYYWDLSSAKENLERAMELNPNISNTYKLYAEILSISGQVNRALEMDNLALALDPFSPIINSMYGLHLSYAHQSDSGISHLTNMIMLYPDIGLYHWFLGAIYLYEGEYNRCIEELEKGMDLSGYSFFWMARLGLAYSKIGKLDETQKILDTFEARSRELYVPYYLKAVLLSELGHIEEALNCLNKAYKEKEEFLLDEDVFAFSNLRSDPRFIEIIEKVWMEK